MNDSHSDAFVFLAPPATWPSRKFSRHCKPWSGAAASTCPSSESQRLLDPGRFGPGPGEP